MLAYIGWRQQHDSTATILNHILIQWDILSCLPYPTNTWYDFLQNVSNFEEPVLILIGLLSWSLVIVGKMNVLPQELICVMLHCVLNIGHAIAIGRTLPHFSQQFLVRFEVCPLEYEDSYPEYNKSRSNMPLGLLPIRTMVVPRSWFSIGQCGNGFQIRSLLGIAFIIKCPLLNCTQESSKQ